MCIQSLFPCILQVSNIGVCCYKEIVEQHLAPCVAQLAISAGKDSLWKTLNHKLLMKTRDKDAKVSLRMCIIHDCMGV